VRRTKEGELIDVSVTLSPILDRAGAIVGISTIARDITDQKRAERAARADRTLLNVTLSSIGDAVVTTDTAGRVTFMNPVAAGLSGWAVEDALGQPLESVLVLVNELTRQPADNPVARVLRHGHIVGLANHTILIGRDGREHPIDDSAAPIHDERGEVFGVVMVFHDVSLRRRHEQDLRRLAAVVESSDERCGAVVTTADSAPSALLLLREDRPDILISDIGMPGLDGYELIRRVRNMEHSAGSPATPAIALTAYAGAEDRKRALESGLQSHIGKPVDPLQVAAAVLRWVRT